MMKRPNQNTEIDSESTFKAFSKPALPPSFHPQLSTWVHEQSAILIKVRLELIISGRKILKCHVIRGGNWAGRRTVTMTTARVNDQKKVRTFYF